MARPARELHEEPAERVLKFLQFLLADYHPRNFTIALWDGVAWPPETNQFRRFTWKINNPSALREALLARNRELALARAYLGGDFDIEGDLEAIFPLADYLIRKNWTTSAKLRLLQMALGLGSGQGQKEQSDPLPIALFQGKQHSRERDQQAIRYHYDVSNDFYTLWLDQNMVYSCAYFGDPQEDIDTAQLRKLDCICQKLRLRVGERFLDIGCGWGGLIVHAAQKYGVRATGITLSRQQYDWASERIHDLGLTDRCEVLLCDYRDVDGSFDKVASIGMVEHVGASQLAEYFRSAFQLLRPGGVFLNSGIGSPESRRPEDASSFTDAYIFPDGELVSIGTLLSYAERSGFDVCDVENMREHYMWTARKWLHRLEAHAADARHLVGELKYRMWRLYLAGSAYYFRAGLLGLYHTLLQKPAGNLA